MDIHDTNKSLFPASTRLVFFLSWQLSLYIMNTSIYSNPLTVVSNMDENIDSNYEDNVFSHVVAKICGLVSDYLGNEKIGEPVKKCLRGKKM